jgi:hypothetical protein
MRGKGFILAAILVLLPSAKASVTFNPTFDSSLTATEDMAIQAALTLISSEISSTNTVVDKLYFTSMTSGLGESLTSEYLPTYQQYYDALSAVATSPTQLAAIASLGAAPTGPSSGNPVDGNTGIVITSAEGRNLGFNTPGAVTVGSVTDFDSEISLNVSITSPPNSLAGFYSLESVAMHEIDESLGIGGTGSTLDGTGSLTGPVGDLDLFRYSAPGVRSYVNTNSTNPLSYFSIDGGNTVLSYFSQTTGADFADWFSNCTSATLCQANGLPNGFNPQVQDAFGQPSTSPVLGPNELTAFNVIGYQVTAPEPSTFALAGLGLALGFAFVRRRRRTV